MTTKTRLTIPLLLMLSMLPATVSNAQATYLHRAHVRRYRVSHRNHLRQQHWQNQNYRRSVGLSDGGHYTRQRMTNVGYRAGRGLNRFGHGLHHFGHRLWQGLTGR